MKNGSTSRGFGNLGGGTVPNRPTTGAAQPFSPPLPVASPPLSSPGAASPKKSRVKLWVTGGILVVLLAGVGTAFGIYHHENRNVALPGMRVAGHSVRGMDEKKLTEFIEAKVRDTKLQLQGAAVPALNARDLGITVDTKRSVGEVLKPNRQLPTFVAAMFQDRNVALKLHVEYAKLYQQARSLTSNEGVNASPVEPAISFDQQTGKFIVTPGSSGVGVDPDWLKDEMVKALNQGETKPVTVKKQVLAPLHQAQELQPLADDANAFLGVKIELEGEKNRYRATPVEKTAFIRIPSALSKKLANVQVNPEALGEWVEKQSAKEKREKVNGTRMLDASGQVITIREKKIDGHEVANVADLKTAAQRSFARKKDFHGMMALKPVAAQWNDLLAAPGAQNLPFVASEGERWIDININPQVRTVTGYVGAAPVAGPFPMVPGLPATPTVTGQFKVYIKRATQTMRGENADGSRYISPGVHWILYFHEGYATHSASGWRSTYGPGAPGGSHGCVNMSEETAKAIYDFASVGTPVAVHE